MRECAGYAGRWHVLQISLCSGQPGEYLRAVQLPCVGDGVRVLGHCQNDVRNRVRAQRHMVSGDLHRAGCGTGTHPGCGAAIGIRALYPVALVANQVFGGGGVAAGVACAMLERLQS